MCREDGRGRGGAELGEGHDRSGEGLSGNGRDEKGRLTQNKGMPVVLLVRGIKRSRFGNGVLSEISEEGEIGL